MPDDRKPDDEPDADAKQAPRTTESAERLADDATVRTADKTDMDAVGDDGQVFGG